MRQNGISNLCTMRWRIVSMRDLEVLAHLRAPNRVSFDFGLILINNSQHRSLVMVSHLVLARQNGLWAHIHSFVSLPSLGTLRIRSLNIVRPFRLMPFVALMLMETLVWNSACAVHGHW